MVTTEGLGVGELELPQQAPTEPEPSGQEPPAEPVVEAQLEPPAEPNYKALLEEREQELEKAKRDLKAISTGQLRQQERDDKLYSRINDDISGLTKTVAAMAKGLASGETEGLQAEIEGIQAQVQQNRTQSNLMSRFQVLFDHANQAVKSSDGAVIPGLVTQPEYGAAVAAWDVAAKAGRYEDAAEAVARISSVAHRVDRENWERQRAADQQAAKESTQQAKRQALADAAVMDLDIGAGASAGGVTVTKDNIDALYLKDPERYGVQYRRFVHTGQL